MPCILEQFEVSNFKPFNRNVKICFTASDYDWNTNAVNKGIVSKALLYGRNGAGKSSLLRAITDIKSNMGMVGKSFGLKGLPGHSGDDIVTFRYSFKFLGTTIVYQYNKYWPCYSIPFNDEIYMNGRYVIPNDSVFQTAVDAISKFIWGMKFVDLSESCFTGHSPTSFLQYIVRDGLVGELEKFLYTYHSKVRLDTYKTDTHTDIIIKDSINQMGKPMYFSSVASLGEMSLSGLFYYMQEMRKCSFMAIDAFDVFLCSEVASDILSLLIEQFPNVQMLITANNTDLLSNDILRPDCYFIIGKHGIKPLQELTNKEIRKAHNLQRMFKAGAFEQ